MKELELILDDMSKEYSNIERKIETYDLSQIAKLKLYNKQLLEDAECIMKAIQLYNNQYWKEGI